jgi:hypothetical protein
MSVGQPKTTGSYHMPRTRSLNVFAGATSSVGSGASFDSGSESEEGLSAGPAFLLAYFTSFALGRWDVFNRLEDISNCRCEGGYGISLWAEKFGGEVCIVEKKSGLDVISAFRGLQQGLGFYVRLGHRKQPAKDLAEIIVLSWTLSAMSIPAGAPHH